jgi:hypothetical protein
MPDMMDSEDTMQGDTGMDKPGMGESDNEPVSVFLPKAALEGQSVKPGDTITLKVKDVDSETGDVEAVCQYDEEPKQGESMEDQFDSAMPEE